MTNTAEEEAEVARVLLEICLPQTIISECATPIVAWLRKTIQREPRISTSETTTSACLHPDVIDCAKSLTKIKWPSELDTVHTTNTSEPYKKRIVRVFRDADHPELLRINFGMS